VRRPTASYLDGLHRRDAGTRVAITAIVVSGRRPTQAVPANAQRRFAARMGATTVEVTASHLVMVSRPATVSDLIEEAAAAL